MRLTLLMLALLAVPAFAGCLQAPDDPAQDPSASIANVGGAAGASVTAVFPGTYDFKGPFSRVLVPGTLPIKPGQRVTIPSPIDGRAIEMGLNLPDTKDKVPVLLFASPYFFAEGSPGGTRTVLDRTGAFGQLVEAFVPHGYAVVALAVRGTAGSSGCNDLMGPDEIKDLDAAVTWLGTQAWSTGAIGMTGVSYDGSTPWSVASTGNKYLKTIAPISGVPDIYGLMYRNGSSEQRGPLLLNALYVEGSLASGTPADAPFRLCAEAAEGLALSGVAGAAGTDPTGYWQARNRKAAVEQNYKGSVFSIQGLQDWNVDSSQVIPWVDHLESMGLRTKQLLGQWEHSWPDSIGVDGKGLDCPNGNAGVKVCNRADWKEVLLRWLDQELKGKTVDTGAPVQVTDDTGRWRNELHYPPHDTLWTTYNLSKTFLLPDKASERSSVMLLPHAAEGIPPQMPSAVAGTAHSAADFDTAPVEKETLIVGLPKVHVTVTPQASGGYLAAYLYDMSPDGKLRRIGWTTMNLAYADGTTTRTEVVPGMPLLAKMEVQPMDSVIPEGHQLRLRLWVFTDGDRMPTVPPGSVTLEMGPGITSILRLPTVQRDPAVYFEAPRLK
ncbi:MAG TPA: CocE/NonD family hydrolase [Candidatus Thermoplasmatota archaeon]|nr:CocE/NonD family hydrolase [Candidatus Thermoplasmatota archaeon]